MADRCVACCSQVPSSKIKLLGETVLGGPHQKQMPPTHTCTHYNWIIMLLKFDLSTAALL